MVVGFRLGTPDRLRNLQACLFALSAQTWPCIVILVEQDSEVRFEAGDAYCHAHIHDAWGGPYNRSRALNRGAAEAGGGPLCLMDADLFVDEGWAERCVAALEKAGAVIPFERVAYLDERETMKAIWARMDGQERKPKARRYASDSVGGAMWMQAELYSQVEGHDEGFVGWGSEDLDFFYRVRKATNICRLKGTISHLYHSRTSAAAGDGRQNRRRLVGLHGSPLPKIGTLPVL